MFYSGPRPRHPDIASGEVRHHPLGADQAEQARHAVHLPGADAASARQAERSVPIK